MPMSPRQGGPTQLEAHEAAGAFHARETASEAEKGVSKQSYHNLGRDMTALAAIMAREGAPPVSQEEPRAVRNGALGRQKRS